MPNSVSFKWDEVPSDVPSCGSQTFTWSYEGPDTAIFAISLSNGEDLVDNVKPSALSWTWSPVNVTTGRYSLTASISSVSSGNSTADSEGSPSFSVTSGDEAFPCLSGSTPSPSTSLAEVPSSSSTRSPLSSTSTLSPVSSASISPSTAAPSSLPATVATNSSFSATNPFTRSFTTTGNFTATSSTTGSSTTSAAQTGATVTTSTSSLPQTHIGAIVGGVLGVLAILAGIAVAFCLRRRRRKRARTLAHASDVDHTAGGTRPDPYTATSGQFPVIGQPATPPLTGEKQLRQPLRYGPRNESPVVEVRALDQPSSPERTGGHGVELSQESEEMVSVSVSTLQRLLRRVRGVSSDFQPPRAEVEDTNSSIAPPKYEEVVRS